MVGLIDLGEGLGVHYQDYSLFALHVILRVNEKFVVLFKAHAVPKLYVDCEFLSVQVQYLFYVRNLIFVGLSNMSFHLGFSLVWQFLEVVGVYSHKAVLVIVWPYTCSYTGGNAVLQRLNLTRVGSWYVLLRPGLLFLLLDVVGDQPSFANSMLANYADSDVQRSFLAVQEIVNGHLPGLVQLLWRTGELCSSQVDSWCSQNVLWYFAKVVLSKPVEIKLCIDITWVAFWFYDVQIIEAVVLNVLFWVPPWSSAESVFLPKGVGHFLFAYILRRLPSLTIVILGLFHLLMEI